MKFGSRPVVATLQKAGAKAGVPYQAPLAPDRSTTRDAAKAVAQSIALLQRSSAEFFKQSGCVGCHHQDATAFAVRASRDAGIPLDEAVAQERLNVMQSSLGSEQELQLQGVLDEAVSIKTNHLAGLWASGYNPDLVTDAAVVSLVSGQYTDGHWQRYIGAVRSPTGVNNIVGTAEAVLALQRYGMPARAAEFRERVTRRPPGYKKQHRRAHMNMPSNCWRCPQQAPGKTQSGESQTRFSPNNGGMADGQATRISAATRIPRVWPCMLCARAGSWAQET
jgi:hypothetical protein